MAGLVAGSVVLVLALAHVSTDLTPEDEAALERLLTDLTPMDRDATFSKTVELVREVQARVLAAAPTNSGIPKGQPREPADLLRLGTGLCYDRSRVIEKALAYLGLETRHLAVYGAERGALQALTTPMNPSHALSEVSTPKGWMLVDSNSPEIGLTPGGRPVSAAELAACDVTLESEPDFVRRTVGAKFITVYGLFSRHGEFYPPYVPVPDVHLGQALANLKFGAVKCSP
jgi:hypothetical protein